MQEPRIMSDQQLMEKFPTMKHSPDPQRAMPGTSASRDPTKPATKGETTTTPQSGEMRCPKCTLTFSATTRLRRHLQSHSVDRPHICHICCQSFKEKVKLEVHRRTHKKGRLYVCSTCYRGFEISGKLRRHEKTHTGEKPHVCWTCNKGFIRKGQLTVHSRTHSGERPYKCNICEKSFMSSRPLKVHQRKHSGERPYECSTCRKSFAYAHVLKIHQLSHASQKQFMCKKCSKVFRNRQNLNVHLRRCVMSALHTHSANNLGINLFEAQTAKIRGSRRSPTLLQYPITKSSAALCPAGYNGPRTLAFFPREAPSGSVQTAVYTDIFHQPNACKNNGIQLQTSGSGFSSMPDHEDPDSQQLLLSDCKVDLESKPATRTTDATTQHDGRPEQALQTGLTYVEYHDPKNMSVSNEVTPRPTQTVVLGAIFHQPNDPVLESTNNGSHQHISINEPTFHERLDQEYFQIPHVYPDGNADLSSKWTMSRKDLPTQYDGHMVQPGQAHASHSTGSTNVRYNGPKNTTFISKEMKTSAPTAVLDRIFYQPNDQMLTSTNDVSQQRTSLNEANLQESSNYEYRALPQIYPDDNVDLSSESSMTNLIQPTQHDGHTGQLEHAPNEHRTVPSDLVCPVRCRSLESVFGEGANVLKSTNIGHLQISTNEPYFCKTSNHQFSNRIPSMENYYSLTRSNRIFRTKTVQFRSESSATTTAEHTHYDRLKAQSQQAHTSTTVPTQDLDYHQQHIQESMTAKPTGPMVRYTGPFGNCSPRYNKVRKRDERHSL